MKMNREYPFAVWTTPLAGGILRQIAWNHYIFIEDGQQGSGYQIGDDFYSDKFLIPVNDLAKAIQSVSNGVFTVGSNETNLLMNGVCVGNIFSAPYKEELLRRVCTTLNIVRGIDTSEIASHIHATFIDVPDEPSDRSYPSQL